MKSKTKKILERLSFSQNAKTVEVMKKYSWLLTNCVENGRFALLDLYIRQLNQMYEKFVYRENKFDEKTAVEILEKFVNSKIVEG